MHQSQLRKPNMTQKHFLTFSSRQTALRQLSNFWESSERPLMFQGRLFRSGEHAFHAAKFRVAAMSHTCGPRQALLLAKSQTFELNGDLTVKEAKAAGGKGKTGLRLEGNEIEKWNEASFDVQIELCQAKLAQYDEVRFVLAETGDAVLVHTAFRITDEKLAEDAMRWDGRVVTGEVIGGNRLGNAWMQVRTMISDEVVVTV